MSGNDIDPGGAEEGTSSFAANRRTLLTGVVSTLVSFLGGLQVAVNDGAVTANEWVDISLMTVLGAAAGFGITWTRVSK